MTTLDNSMSNQGQTALNRLLLAVVNMSALGMGVAAAVPVLLLGTSLGLDTGRILGWALGSLLAGWLIGALLQYITRPSTDRVLDRFIQTLDMVVLGDLRQRLELSDISVNTSEEQRLRRLGDAVNRMLDRLQGIVTEISDAVARVDVDTQEILAAAARQMSMTNEQDTVVTETTATVNEVRATVTETAERAQSVAETAQVSVNISKAGTEAVSQTISGMELIRGRVEDIADNILVLSENTQQIGEIIATVNSLADQSRMLALNASVEAARAGEEGKGFAVVALEVRNLADQNREATVQVREILGEIQRATNAAVMVTEEGSKGVDHGQQLVNSAGESIRDLSRAIEEAALAAMQIAASTRQQTIGMDQLTQAMRTIKQSTGETLNATLQVKSSVQNLRDAAFRINAVLSGLKL
jgi:methyl-accepting chemotaxis protein